MTLDLNSAHVGRSWRGTRLEDDCPCGKASCGLVDMQQVSSDCDQHRFSAAKTMRQMHFAKDCDPSTKE